MSVYNSHIIGPRTLPDPSFLHNYLISLAIFPSLTVKSKFKPFIGILKISLRLCY